MADLRCSSCEFPLGATCVLSVIVALDYRNTFVIRWLTGTSHSKRYLLQLGSLD